MVKILSFLQHFFLYKKFPWSKNYYLSKFYSSQDLQILHQAEEHIPELGHEFTYSRNALLLLDFKKILVIWLDAVLSARVLQNFKLPTLENRCQSYGNWPGRKPAKHKGSPHACFLINVQELFGIIFRTRGNFSIFCYDF